MFKSTEIGADESPSIWYIQDAKGGIWRVDVAHTHTVKAPSKILSCHAGKVLGMDVCPRAHFVATTGEDGYVRVHDYTNRSTLVSLKADADAQGSCVAWLPLAVSPILLRSCVL
jgi:WD40 repeat protein